MRFLGFVVFTVLAATSCLALAQELVLAQDGQSQAVIVVAKEAPAPDQHAAAELAAFLKQITGGEFPIVNQVAGGQIRLLVGPSAARLADPKFSTEGLGTDGIVLRTVGRDLILAGGEPRGTLYAVYTFLEENLGCHWWSASVSTIAHQPTLKIPPLDVRYVPQITYREPMWQDAQNADWCVRNKINGSHTLLDDLHGGKYQILDFVHTFYRLIPPDKYFKDHPDWFSEVDGKRLASGGQLCLTNPQLKQEMIQVVLQRLREHPGVSTTSISQNDWGNYCQCPNCAALDHAEGDTPAGSIIHFVNDVAQAVEKEFPHVTISTLAYEYSQKPPTHVRPRHNVTVWLCATGVSYAHAVTNEHNKVFRQRLETWSKAADHITIWDYDVNFGNYVSPYPNLRTLGPNIKFYADHHVTGVLAQGAYGASGTEFSELRSWVLAKLLWNPNLDGQKLIDQFLAGYYGPAAPHIKAYIDTIHDAIAKTDETLEMTSPPLGKWLSIQTLVTSLNHLRLAERAAGRDEALRLRVKVAKLPVLYVFLMRWDELKQQAADQNIRWPFERPIAEVYADFLAVAKERGITQWSESNARDAFQSVAERVALRPGTAPPSGCEKLPAGSWVDIQDSSFNRKDAATIVSDPKASDGSAARMDGSIDIPAIQKQLWRIFLVHAAAFHGKKLQVKASVRCQIDPGASGVAYTCGITGDSESINIFKTQATVDQFADGQYHTVDLGVHDDLRGWKSAWFAPAKNPGVKEIFVDRMWLVEE